MNRDLKIYLLVIGVPALLFALGGLRLLNVESERTSTLGHDALKAQARLAASDIRRRIRECVEVVRERTEEMPEWTDEAFASIVKTEPLVRAIKVIPPRKKGDDRWRTRVELEPLAVLARVPGWLEESGAQTPATRHGRPSAHSVLGQPPRHVLCVLRPRPRTAWTSLGRGVARRT